MTDERSLSVRQVADKVEGADELWLRRRIRTGDIKIERTGYNYRIPATELPKIRRLAAARAGK